MSLICTFLFIPSSFSTAAENEPIRLQAYWDLVADLETKLASQPQINQADLLIYAIQFEEISQVVLPSGEIISIDNSILVAQLRQENPDYNHLRRYLSGLLATQESWTQSTLPQDSIATLEKILSAPEFQWKTAQPSLLKQWVNKLIQQLLDFLSRLFPEGETGAETLVGPGVNAMVTIISILLVLMILGFVLMQLFRSFVPEAALEMDEEGQGEVTNSKNALKRAQQLSQSGDYRSAVRYLYLSSLLVLEERGVLRYDRTKTNREYLRELSAQPALEEVLEEVVDIYDHVWYGYRKLEKEDFDQYSEHVADLNKLK